MELWDSGVMKINSVITKMDEKSIEKLTVLLPQEEINIIKKPETGLLMMAAKDSFDTDFYLGEILITEAGVEYKGLKGYAMVMGDEPEKALLAASVDAILQADDRDEMEDLKQKVMDIITAQTEKTAEADEMEKRLIAKTRVNFETMVKG
jgi:alpha-D-ribose 1-methylphosphonate 5-triphosphate synthase subunit PhnG